MALATNSQVDPVSGPNAPPVANADSGFITPPHTDLTLSTGALLANDFDPDGDPLTVTGVESLLRDGRVDTGHVSFDPHTNTITFTPSPDSLVFGPASFVYTVSDGRGASASAVVNLTVGHSLWGNSDKPAVITVNDPRAAELGVKFTVTTGNAITGIRFYKSPQNTGTHVVDLWSSTGTLLASATATNETPSGWQEADFATRISIQPGATYIAAYHTDTGFYSADTGYFNNARTTGPLTAPSSGTSGGNGVYIYSASSAFPTNTFQAANYWVDPVMNHPADVSPLLNPDKNFITAPNTAMTLSAATLLANDYETNGLALRLIDAFTTPDNGTASFNARDNTVIFTPTAGYTGPARFTYVATDISNMGAQSPPVSLTVANSIFGNSDTPAVVTVPDSHPAELGVKFTASSAGTINGIRFYKGPQNTGTHEVDLWSSTGTKLATATAADETPSGWQQADFTTPVSIAAGTTYIAAYHTNTGFYSADTRYFNNARTAGPLTASSAGTGGGNGVYIYSANSAFPTNSFNATNYWVDAVFTPNTLANRDSGFITAPNTAMTLLAATLLANDFDRDGDTLAVTGVSAPTNGTVSFNAQDNTVTFIPTKGFSGPANFTYSVSDGHGESASGLVSLTVANSLFRNSDTPAVVNVNDSTSAVLGVKFTAQSAGTITGIRFYKGPENTGDHFGDLRSADGTIIESVMFTNESASGWQQVDFPTPIPIKAGTTYIAAYDTSGHYSATSNYFANAHANGPLTAPASSTSGGNGVYGVNPPHTIDGIPSMSFNATNYWVDPVFDPNTQPVAKDLSGLITAPNTIMTLSTATLLANASDADGDTLTLRDVLGAVNGTVSFNAQNNTVAFTPTPGYAGPATFDYEVSDGHGFSARASVHLTVANSLFGKSDTPAAITANDPHPAELGVKFTASSAGTINGIRFYKGPQNTGTHVVDLWSSTGTLLASATATDETASGWQEADFTIPVAIAPGKTYIGAYHTNTGFYSADSGYFNNARTNGPLTAPSNGTSGGNGVYAYSASDAFPTNTFHASNYWVDPVFQPQIVA